jgi:hypothetical protein
MRIEVELQKILQGQRIAKQNTVTCVDLDLAGRRGRGGLDPVCNQNRARTGLHLIPASGQAVEPEEMINTNG